MSSEQIIDANIAAAQQASKISILKFKYTSKKMVDREQEMDIEKSKAEK
jgi:hypothetical protein